MYICEVSRNLHVTTTQLGRCQNLQRLYVDIDLAEVFSRLTVHAHKLRSWREGRVAAASASAEKDSEGSTRPAKRRRVEEAKRPDTPLNMRISAAQTCGLKQLEVTWDASNRGAKNLFAGDRQYDWGEPPHEEPKAAVLGYLRAFLEPGCEVVVVVEDIVEGDFVHPVE
ncbi:uncharacterized protein BDZ99DRAFT_464499 [Mytilinidion resinicola]|uniref:Uncharacterized protein n=1 Tax=Mytilinidion resinicola TaxID=574789 RepID=A0A6A6YLB2_9PEZI|nr:uncharacterized protein BDZ99DRAFT_464499 [Mytilinidion resinicola]KAF2808657.1 hypothetical protein BDZ99DRAFT_464499 [Mytilinidion resinicola]